VLVPVANPTTAPGLIRMAWKLADKERGRILALYVTLSGSEMNEDTFEALTRIVDAATHSGITIELITQTSPSIARGILDAALEHGATLMVLGFQAPARGRVALGPVVESLARTTPCDLVVFRNPMHSMINLDDVEHVILPLNGSDNSRVAARLGLTLADVYNAQPNAIYVQTDPDLPSWFGLARIEASLTGLDDTHRVQRQVVRANDIVKGILTRCNQNDMIVLGFSEQSSLDQWIFGNVAQRMLSQAPGPVIIAKRAIRAGLTPTQKLRRRWITRFSPTLTPSEQTAVSRQAIELSQPGINFTVLMVISTLIAALGLLQNSAAVIIGAMLIAPLMSPLMSFSVGLVQGNLRLMRTAAVTTLTGVLIGLAMAIAIGVVMPINTATTEMLSRGQPSVLDMGVALASGLAGAYAMARKDIPSALAGVAIAWLGLRPRGENHTRRQLVVALVVLGLLALPLASTFIGVIRTGQQTDSAQQVLQDQFKGADVIDVQLNGNDVTATILSPDPITQQDAQQAEKAIAAKLGHSVNLEITYWAAVKP
jgi:uncharacterized hydrophobic protein (TIGR00271 family)